MIIGRILPRDVTPPTTRSIKNQGKGKDENSGFEDALVTELTSAIEKTSDDKKERSRQEAGDEAPAGELPIEELVTIAQENAPATAPVVPMAKKLNIEA